MLPIAFLSDYGNEDEFAGTCRAVIQRIAPGAIVTDVTHGVPRGDVAAGALVLRNALPFLPAGVCLAVVDPGVGTKRRALALRCAGEHLLVGPDNGLLWPAAERSGGIVCAVELSAGPFRLEPVSATFQGRDLFAPAAARLALGAAVEEAGTAVDPAGLVRLGFPPPRVGRGEVEAEIAAVDRFGNLQLHLAREDLDRAGLAAGSPLRVEVVAAPATVDASAAVAGGRGEHGGAEGAGAVPRAEAAAAQRGRTFADAAPAGLVVYEDSARMVAVAADGGSAASTLGAAAGQLLRIAAE